MQALEIVFFKGSSRRYRSLLLGLERGVWGVLAAGRWAELGPGGR